MVIFFYNIIFINLNISIKPLKKILFREGDSLIWTLKYTELTPYTPLRILRYRWIDTLFI